MTSNDRNRDYDELAAMVTAIVRFHVETTRTDLKFLSQVLDGGKVPKEVVEVLRPIVWKLLAADPKAPVALLPAELIQLECLQQENAAVIEQRRVTQRKLEEAVTGDRWSGAENTIAACAGRQVLPLSAQSLGLLSIQVHQSDFSAEEIIGAFSGEQGPLSDFSVRWMADNHDHGEEWDLEEGNQQEAGPPEKILGMNRGFLVSHAILYLYASRLPGELIKFLKRRGVPHAGKLREDVLRVYRDR